MSRNPSLQTTALKLAREGLPFRMFKDANGNTVLENLTDGKTSASIQQSEDELARETDRAFDVAFGKGLRGA